MTAYRALCDWLEQSAQFAEDTREPLKATYAALLSGIQIAREIHDMSDSWAELIAEIQLHAEVIDLYIMDRQHSKLELNGNAQLREAIGQYLGVIQDIMVEAERGLSAAMPYPRASRFGMMRIDQKRIEQLREREATAFQRYRASASVVLYSRVGDAAKTIREIREEVEISLSWTQRNDDYGALASIMQSFYGTELEACEKGTRRDVLMRIEDWGSNMRPEAKQIFWLKDAAGTGKSTVAATMVKEWQSRNQLAGRFFFTPNVVPNRGIHYFCRAIAKDIAFHFDNIANRVEAAILSSQENSSSFHVQFERLVLEPLREVGRRPVFLVVDALDNCEYYDRQSLLKTMLATLSSVPHLRVLLTSRPLQDIVDTLHGSPMICGDDVQLLDVDNIPYEDIRLYVDARLQDLTTEDRQRITKHAHGLFIWVATFYRAFKDPRVQRRILDNLSHAQVTSPLDTLYLDVLEQARQVDTGIKDELRRILQIIISAFQPISINTICALFPRVQAVDTIVQDLAGVLKDGHPDRPIKVLHPTFRDFIASTPDRANGFVVELDPSHEMLAKACMNVLARVLEFDLLQVLHARGDGGIPRNADVANLGALVEKQFSAAVRYASAYWALHITSSDGAWSDWTRLRLFLQENFVHWVELMSWRGMVGHALYALSQLNRMVKRSSITEIRPWDKAIVQQAFHFLLKYQALIAESALHTYTVPVALSRRDSALLRKVRTVKTIPTLKVITSETATSSDHQILLTGNKDGLQTVRISRDADRVLCVGAEGSLCLWDTDTGSMVGTPIEGQRGGRAVRYAELCINGTRLAYATGPGMLHLWDASLGRPIWERNYKRDLKPWYEPNSWGHILRFSPTKSYLALLTRCHGQGVDWRTIVSFYDTDVGVPMDHRVLFEDEAILDFEFSPDGQRAVFVGERETANVGVAFVYDMETFRQLSRIEMAYMELLTLSIAVSADSTRFAITFRLNRLGRKDVKAPMVLLDARTGDEIVDESPPPLSSPSFHLVRFAPVGEIMACIPRTGSDVVLRDRRTGRDVGFLRSRAQTLDAWFSLDGKRLAVLSSEETIDVWDVATHSIVSRRFGGYVGMGGDGEHVVLSEDWSKLFAYSWMGSNEICVYDTLTPTGAITVVSPATRKKKKIKSPPTRGVFVDDMRFIGPFYSDTEHPTCIWRIVPGEEERMEIVETMDELQGLSECIVCPDGQSMALTLPGRLVFYSTTCRPEPLLIRLENMRDEVARGLGTKVFSANGRILACSNQRFTQVWAYPSGQFIWEAGGTVGLGDHVALSSDGTRIVGKLEEEKQLAVYDLEQKEWIKSDRDDLFGLYFRFAFSKDGRMVATITKQGLEVWKVGERAMGMVAREDFTASFLERQSLVFDENVVYGYRVWQLGIQGDQVVMERCKGSRDLIVGYEDGWIWSGAYGPRREIPVATYMRPWLSYGRYSVRGWRVLVWDECYSPVILVLVPAWRLPERA
ncbi:related to WD-repeat protein, putative-Talaromyces stipitatus [Serendipita indica DSM 11827]|uniref:Related to WD-repeat protein, putative-Talaromyces stipitatus n=1 Tax=Serendipita indica (strain DSM 11827) TaxID=1109443 RepID=G4TGK9_SERID|nr:related to WD-repeat protein, putative-Talaromyces stipitatus [Serendipita indica DSM 11827]